MPEWGGGWLLCIPSRDTQIENMSKTCNVKQIKIFLIVLKETTQDRGQWIQATGQQPHRNRQTGSVQWLISKNIWRLNRTTRQAKVKTRKGRSKDGRKSHYQATGLVFMVYCKAYNFPEDFTFAFWGWWKLLIVRPAENTFIM